MPMLQRLSSYMSCTRLTESAICAICDAERHDARLTHNDTITFPPDIPVGNPYRYRVEFSFKHFLFFSTAKYFFHIGVELLGHCRQHCE